MYKNYTPKHKKITNGIPMYSCQGKHIGDVIGNEWRKDIRNSHMLTTPPAIANDVQALHDAIRAGAEYFVATNKDSGIIYKASIAKFFDKGVPMNRGYGNQIYLCLADFLQSRDPNFIPPSDPEPPALDVHNVKPLIYKSHAPTGITFNGVKQLSLFGEVK
ncbi:MAG: hypothetical protein C4586_03715 [Anaerolineaceae bacterium]|nr:MAG: hypothetical protein C4586_03715 [Anaerolineaceae bacterium]